MNATALPKPLAVFCLFAATMVLSGCAASHQLTQSAFTSPVSPPADKALVYFYRSPGEISVKAHQYPLLANGQIVTEMLDGGYYCYAAAPGHVKFESYDKALGPKMSTTAAVLNGGLIGYAVNKYGIPENAVLEMDVAPGRVYYVKYQPEAEGKPFVGQLIPLADGVAMNEITGCRLIK